jgi:hypothetical protein
LPFNSGEKVLPFKPVWMHEWEQKQIGVYKNLKNGKTSTTNFFK